MFENNQLLEDSNLILELSDEQSEKISGGIKTFSIENATNARVSYYIDGAYYKQGSGSTIQWATTGDGLIEFDSSYSEGWQVVEYNLKNNESYIFRLDRDKEWSSGDFNLYHVT